MFRYIKEEAKKLLASQRSIFPVGKINVCFKFPDKNFQNSDPPEKEKISNDLKEIKKKT